MTIALVNFRVPTTEDYNFLLSSWLKSARLQHEQVDDAIYFSYYKTLVKTLLATKDTLLAVDPEDESSIIGYVTYDNQAVHYLYVKHALRNFGIAKQLIAVTNLDKPITVTSSSKALRSYQSKHPGLISYNPFLQSQVQP